MNMTLQDFVEYYEDLANEAERVNKQIKKGGG